MNCHGVYFTPFLHWSDSHYFIYSVISLKFFDFSSLFKLFIYIEKLFHFDLKLHCNLNFKILFHGLPVGYGIPHILCSDCFHILNFVTRDIMSYRVISYPETPQSLILLKKHCFSHFDILYFEINKFMNLRIIVLHTPQKNVSIFWMLIAEVFFSRVFKYLLRP